MADTTDTIVWRKIKSVDPYEWIKHNFLPGENIELYEHFYGDVWIRNEGNVIHFRFCDIDADLEGGITIYDI